MKPTYEELETRLATVAAENAGLNKFIAESCFVQSGEVPSWHQAIDHAPETPATAAFLAELQAQTWSEAKEFTKAILETECLEDLNLLLDCIDVQFDKKVQQFRQEAK